MISFYCGATEPSIAGFPQTPSRMLRQPAETFRDRRACFDFATSLDENTRRSVPRSLGRFLIRALRRDVSAAACLSAFPKVPA
jgi:hypothetical protein